MKILYKAWKIGNEVSSNQQHLLDDFYYGTRGQARDKAWEEVEGIEDPLGDKISYLNLSMIRDKNNDIVEFEGKKMSRELANIKIGFQKRMNKVKEHESDFFFVQDSRTYIGNSIVFWALNSNGYTSDPMKAHRFTKEEILKSEWRETDKIIPYEDVLKSLKIYCDSQLIPFDKRI